MTWQSQTSSPDRNWGISLPDWKDSLLCKAGLRDILSLGCIPTFRHMSKFNQLKELPKMLAAQGADNIDHVLLTIRTENKISSRVAKELSDILEVTYNH